MLSALPIAETFCGVGNPLALGPLYPGEKVLDVGCGAGLDVILTSQLVGPSGRVCGIDLTPEMVEKARVAWAPAMPARHSRALKQFPYDNDTFDIVISNGVLNLSPLNEQSLREIFRVLRPAGRLQFADIILNEDLPRDVANSLDAWSD